MFASFEPSTVCTRVGRGVATYAQRIKKKTSTTRKTAPRPAAKAAPSATPKPAPAAPLQAEAGDVQRLKDELQRVNQEISKIARVGRPDAARQTNLPEKQELLRQKVDLERKIRAHPKA